MPIYPQNFEALNLRQLSRYNTTTGAPAASVSLPYVRRQHYLSRKQEAVMKTMDSPRAVLPGACGSGAVGRPQSPRFD